MKYLENACPKGFYQVFKTRTANMFDYDENFPIYQNSNLARCHSFAYNEWLNQPEGGTDCWTIIQPFDGSCRGGYGFDDDNDYDEEEQ